MPYKDKLKQVKAQKKHYLINKQKFYNRNTIRRKERKIWFESITYNHCCYFCGEKERCCIDYHHKDPSEKDKSISNLLGTLRSKERILNELKKCIAICSNCHRKIHAGIINF